MTEYRFVGGGPHQFPSYQHPVTDDADKPGVLTVDHGDVIDFGDALPPNSGQWQVQTSKGVWEQWYPPEPEPETEESEAGEGTVVSTAAGHPPRENGDTDQE